MHVLITGGAGFIGSNLVEFHLRKNDQVHVVDDLSTGRMENLSAWADNTALRFDQADVLTWGGLEKAAAWADRIYHMAAVVGVFKVLEDPRTIKWRASISDGALMSRRRLALSAVGCLKSQAAPSKISAAIPPPAHLQPTQSELR